MNFQTHIVIFKRISKEKNKPYYSVLAEIMTPVGVIKTNGFCYENDVQALVNKGAKYVDKTGQQPQTQSQVQVNGQPMNQEQPQASQFDTTSSNASF